MHRIKTGHEVFDFISNFYNGSIILVLDEGHFDSILFLNALLSKLAEEQHVKVITFHEVLTNFEQIKLNSIASLNDLSIFIGQLRRKLGSGVLIHHYICLLYTSPSPRD